MASVPQTTNELLNSLVQPAQASYAKSELPQQSASANEVSPGVAAESAAISLAEVTFVIVDLETTGGLAAQCGITEIGAVKVRFGEVISNFQTFCNPQMPIPDFITQLTGITDEHVQGAPTTEIAVKEFLNWAQLTPEHSTVLVAHNASFDLSFLMHACASHDIEWPEPPILDTLRLARKVIGREEVPNKKLSTLAAYFDAPTTPNHRALDDAMATVAVLHSLLERVAGFGVEDPVTLLEYGWPTPN